MAETSTLKAVFRVIDAYDHPHGGRILRLRLQGGEAPGLKELRGGTLIASHGTEEVRLEVAGFAVFGGKPTDGRLARTGRIDVHVETDAAAHVGPGWELAGPV